MFWHTSQRMRLHFICFCFYLCRERTEADLTSIISTKDAETARLRAEINRLRQAFNQSDDLQKGHASEVAALQAQLQQALASNK